MGAAFGPRLFRDRALSLDQLQDMSFMAFVQPCEALAFLCCIAASLFEFRFATQNELLKKRLRAESERLETRLRATFLVKIMPHCVWTTGVRKPGSQDVSGPVALKTINKTVCYPASGEDGLSTKNLV